MAQVAPNGASAKIACPPVTNKLLIFECFTPTKSTSNKLPVMFWIHGGDFYQGYGGGILYDGTSIAEHENVIVVAKVTIA